MDCTEFRVLPDVRIHIASVRLNLAEARLADGNNESRSKRCGEFFVGRPDRANGVGQDLAHEASLLPTGGACTSATIASIPVDSVLAAVHSLLGIPTSSLRRL